MSPIIVIVLICVGLLGAFFLMSELTTAQLATGASPNTPLATYSVTAIKILMIVMVLYAIYYIVDVIKTSIRERKAADHKAKILEARERSHSSERK